MIKLHSKVVSLALTGAIALVSSAALADGIPRRGLKDAPFVAPFSWTGFYVGVNAGYAWGDSEASSGFGCPTVVGCAYTAPANLAAFSNAGTGSLDPSGFTGGVQAGYNIQSGSLVYGFEMDVNAFNLNASRSVTANVPTLGPSFTATTALDTDWLFTARLRLGWAASSNLLIYATGGLALTELKVANAFSSTAIVTAGASSVNDVQLGWTVGGGIELALDRNWTFKAEYLYVDFDSASTSAAINNVPLVGNNANLFGTAADLSAHIARAGINYKF